MRKRDRRPISLWVLMALIAFLSLGGFYGGIAFLIDPSGALLGFPPDILIALPVSTFFLPGLFLLAVYGILGVVTIVGLLQLPVRHLSVKEGWWHSRHWSWFFALGLGMVLMVWIAVQYLLIGGPYPMQIVCGVLGAAISLLTLLPPVHRYALPSRGVA